MKLIYFLLLGLLAAGCGQQTSEPVNSLVTTENDEGPVTGESAAEEIASQVPDTDIFMVSISAGGLPDPTSLRNLTARPGYDNQPAFPSGGQQLIFRSIRGGLQSDIYVLDVAGGQARRLTDTLQSEYSPTPLPGGGFSVVRVEDDGSQHLWAYRADGTPGRMLLAELDNVGYHLWLSETELALFLVDEPMQLVLANTEAPGLRQVATDIGRSFARDESLGMLYFLVPSTPGQWRLSGYELETGRQFSYLDAPGTSQDMVLDSKGGVWMASGTRLWRWRPGYSEWQAVWDFGVELGGTITRLAFSKDDSSLAMVVSKQSLGAE